MQKILILNGPNLNMLGTREPEIYGYDTLSDIESLCREEAARHYMTADFRQTNHEGELVEWVQEARGSCVGVIINAGAYTHTSVALRDALAMLDIPVMEVHLSNVFRREAFRHHSHISPVATGVICGLGSHGYVLALQAIVELAA